MKKVFVAIAAVVFVFAQFSIARADGPADISDRWLHGRWVAGWCSDAAGPARDPALFLFRKTLELEKTPERFVVHVSADQRYKFYVNGTRVAYGPARGDLMHWRFETLNIAKYMKVGKNVIAAEVWSEGDMAPWAQLGAHTALIVQGDGEIDKDATTPSGWKVSRDSSWQPTPRLGVNASQHVTGANERVDGSLHPWDWMSPDFDDSTWKTPEVVADGVSVGLLGDGSSLWQLTPRPIPLMFEALDRFPKVARAKKANVPDGFLEGKAPMTIPPKTKASILFDRQFIVNGFPELVVSGGRGSKVRLSYEEALFKYPDVAVGRLVKGNRNDIQKCAIRENYKLDEFLPDGGKSRLFTTLWWRSFRFVQMDIETADEPLTIDDLRVVATGYPFEAKASFDASDPTLKTIWEVGWRTARLCAGETYFDCPYYEQLQYGGDMRVETMISYYVAGDDRLARNAIELMADSRLPEGLTMSRYPSRMYQIIPPFSLMWIDIMHDHWMMTGDTSLARKHIWAVREVLAWFEKYRLKNGLLGGMPWWNFVDWSWPGGTPPGTSGAGTSILSLQYALALRDAAAMEDAIGMANEAKLHRALADEIVSAAGKTCWDEKKGLLADSPDKKSFSQHGTVLGVLEGAIPQAQWKRAMKTAIADNSIAQCTLYFRYFLNRAADKAGLGDEYLSLLKPWRDMLALGLTTWPETPIEPRSECHGWSASPTVDLLSIVCGVKPDKGGFSRVVVEPHPGGLDWVKCEVPNPKGMIRVSLKKNQNGYSADVELPDGVPGVFVWKGKETPLKPGKQSPLK